MLCYRFEESLFLYSAVAILAVVAALLRVLRMLSGRVRAEGNPDLATAVDRQARRLGDGLEQQPDLHPASLGHLWALTTEDTAPADHSLWPSGRMNSRKWIIIYAL